MKKMIKYDVAFDFIAYTYVCANVSDLKKQSMQEMKQHPAINKTEKKAMDTYFKEAEHYYNTSLSYMQRNECDMFFSKVSIFKDYLMSITITKKELKTQTLEDFKKFVLSSLDLDETSLNPTLLKKRLINHYDKPNAINDYKKETELILEMIKDDRMFNTIFKNAVVSLKALFIEVKYEEIKNDIETKLAKHNEEYVKNEIEFIVSLTSGMIKEEDLKLSDVQPYITFFTHFKLMINLKCEYAVVIYNHTLENVNNDEHEKDILQSFIKFLSDPKRYKMIQMLSKEKWYANELAKEFKITPATMSYHVNKLFALGLISFEQAEQNKLYIKLDTERLEDLLNRVSKDILNADLD